MVHYIMATTEFKKAMDNIKVSVDNFKKLANGKLNTIESNYVGQLTDKQNTIDTQTNDIKTIATDLSKTLAEIGTVMSSKENDSKKNDTKNGTKKK